MRFSISAAVAAGLLLFVHSVSADVTYQDEYQKRLKVYQTIQPLGDNAFGESVNLYTGELSFSQTDVTVEGIGPPIVITREMVKADPAGGGMTPNGFGDWTLALPQLATLVAQQGKWQVGGTTASLNRCTQFGGIYSPPVYAPKKGGIGRWRWWNGYQLVIPSAGTQDVLVRAVGNTRKPPTGLYPAVTNEDWQIGCLPDTTNATGEGFLALSPEGMRYSLNHLTYAPYETFMEEMDADVVYTLPRHLARMLVTRIEDRFGNALTYTYSDDHRLTSISATDGRRVQIDWAGTLIGAVHVFDVDNPTVKRTWVYSYDANGALKKVTRPDASFWEFTMSGATAAPLFPVQISGCMPGAYVSSGSSPGGQVDGSATIRHPSGATATFSVAWRLHGQSYVPSDCDAVVWNQDVFETENPYFLSLAVVQKSVTGAGFSPMTWTYDYEAPHASVARSCPTSTSCPSTTSVTVTEAQTGITRYTFSTKYDAFQGKLLRTDLLAPDGTLLRAETLEYYLPGTSDTGSSMSGGNGQVAQNNAPVRKRTISQDGREFVWEAMAFDEFRRPTTIVRSSSVPLSSLQAPSPMPGGDIGADSSQSPGAPAAQEESPPPPIAPDAGDSLESVPASEGTGE